MSVKLMMVLAMGALGASAMTTQIPVGGNAATHACVGENCDCSNEACDCENTGVCICDVCCDDDSCCIVTSAAAGCGSCSDCDCDNSACGCLAGDVCVCEDCCQTAGCCTL